jgi:simple sugar transport system ATP-binding protein
MPPAEPAIQLRNLTRRFGPVIACNGVNLEVQPGSIHGIIGENGAGKSTAMKLLYGVYRPDAGEIWVGGRLRHWSSPADAIAAGIGMVHQHFMLAGPHSVLDNILVGAEPVSWGCIARSRARTELEALAERYGFAVDFGKPVEALSVGQQQRVEILKLLYRQANILILDEPTAVLTPQETRALFTNLQKLRDEGKTILLVTHKLKEVMSFTERVTVLRAGKVTGELETSATSPTGLASLMVGRKVVLQVTAPPAQRGAEMVLEVNHLSLASSAGERQRLEDISFSVRAGEIVGVAGVEGNGQSELLQALVHPGERSCRTNGSIICTGQDVSDWPTHRIRELGVAFIPEDRLAEGLLLQSSLANNILLGSQRNPQFQNRGLIAFKNLEQAASAAVKDYDVRPRDLTASAAHLSGGNQQKLIVAREFGRKPKLIIAAQPTGGVDVGATEFIHERIIDARDHGAGVLLVSSELDEILALSDRILVMHGGRFVSQFRRGEVTENELGMAMGGVAGNDK